MTTQITISEPMENGEREIRVGDHVAYGEVAADGETYSVIHAPTQDDFDAIAKALDAASATEIIDAMPDDDSDARREFTDHLRAVATSLESGKFNPWEWLGNDGQAECASTSPTAKALARCTPTDGDSLDAASPRKLRDLADAIEDGTDEI